MSNFNPGKVLMIFFKDRTEREYIIVNAMIRLYCRSFHKGRHYLCPDCAELDDYVRQRLRKCIYSNQKPVCKDCDIHCYSPARRAKIRNVMRWAGPRMIYRYPVYAIIHKIDSNFNSGTTKKIVSNDSF